MPAVPEILPELGESQADFTERVHGALDGALPTNERQRIAFEAWEAAHGDALSQLGIQDDPFDQKRFIRVRNVPIFAEHTTKDSEGNPVVYDRSALAAITDRCNQRIHDTGDFAPLTAGHTPDKEQLAAGRDQPDVLGYCGPYRLGKIGNAKPRWAIFADEWHDKNERPRLEKLRRRSPEVWLEERMEDRILDPIAALGAETPRLDLGLAKLCRLANGREIAKYQMYAGTEPYRCSAPGASFPGAMNTFVPTHGSKKAKNEAGLPPRTPGDGGAMAYASDQARDEGGKFAASQAANSASKALWGYGHAASHSEHHEAAANHRAASHSYHEMGLPELAQEHEHAAGLHDKAKQAHLPHKDYAAGENEYTPLEQTDLQDAIDRDPEHWENDDIHPSVADAESDIEKENGAVHAYSRDGEVDRYYHDGSYGTQTSTGPLSPQAIDQLVMALMQTEPMQYLLDLMQQGPQHAVEQEEPEPAELDEEPEAPVAEEPQEGDEEFEVSGDEPPEPREEDEQPEPEMSDSPEQGEEQVADQTKAPKEGENMKAEDFLKEGEFDGPDEKKHYASMDDDQKCAYAAFKRSYKKRKYEATGVPQKPADEGTIVAGAESPKAAGGETPSTIRNSRGNREDIARYARLERELNETKRQVEALRASERTNTLKLREADRYGRLQQRRNEFAFDLASEWERVKDMPDKFFDMHLDETIVANYQRIPVNVDLWTPPLEAVERHTASQEEKRQVAEEATRRALREPAKYSYESALAEVRKERGLKNAG